jgi:hypothetical protein
MSDLAKFSAGWTEPEQWAWEQIAAGEPADFNARDRRYYAGFTCEQIAAGEPADFKARDQRYYSEFNDLDPCKENGWAENRRLRVRFLQDILTRKIFADITPDAGVRILGALVDDDVPLNLEHTRLQRLIWLEHSRILTDVKCRNLRVDGEFSLEGSFVGGRVELPGANIDSVSLADATFDAEVDIRSVSIDANLAMNGATFTRKVSLNAAKVGRSAFLRKGALRKGATFKAEVDLIGVDIGFNLEMDGANFDGKVNLNSAKVGGSAFLRDGSNFKAEVVLVGASIDADLDMTGSSFEDSVNLNSAKVGGSAYLRDGVFKGVNLGSASIGANLGMTGATFEGAVNLNSAKVGGSAFLSNSAFKDVDLLGASIDASLVITGATFEGKVSLSSAKVGGTAFLRDGATFKDVDLIGADIGSDLDFSNASFTGRVDMTGCHVKRELRLGSSEHQPARWGQTALLVLRNAQVGALQDRWRDPSVNSWPKALELEGFTFDRIGGLFGTGEEANMMARQSRCYVDWLAKDLGSSAQPYEHLASLFRRAGDPGKANDLLFAARERRRRLALSGVDNWGHRKDREVLRGVGLWLLRWTIGYGLGNRYFLVLLWVGGLSLLGMCVLILFGTQSPALWPPLSLFFASLDQLLPIITLNKAYDVLIFGDPSARLDPQPPWLLPQPFWVQVYFYVHMMVGWVLGSFIVAGLAGLTQRN